MLTWDDGKKARRSSFVILLLCSHASQDSASVSASLDVSEQPGDHGLSFSQFERQTFSNIPDVIVPWNGSELGRCASTEMARQKMCEWCAPQPIATSLHGCAASSRPGIWSPTPADMH
jgi:hypothetical protein